MHPHMEHLPQPSQMLNPEHLGHPWHAAHFFLWCRQSVFKLCLLRFPMTVVFFLLFSPPNGHKRRLNATRKMA
jgi:hypothetical protein